MTKYYTLWGSQLVGVKFEVSSDKAPEEFKNLEEFYNYANYEYSKTTYDEELTFETYEVTK